MSLGGSLTGTAGVGGGVGRNKRPDPFKQNELNKLLAEEDTRPIIYGVLSFRIIEARKITASQEASKELLNTYCKISVQDLSKRTKVAANVGGRSVWNQVKHFPVQISRNRRHPNNLVRLQVCSPLSPSSPTHLCFSFNNLLRFTASNKSTSVTASSARWPSTSTTSPAPRGSRGASTSSLPTKSSARFRSPSPSDTGSSAMATRCSSRRRSRRSLAGSTSPCSGAQLHTPVRRVAAVTGVSAAVSGWGARGSGEG